MEIWQTLLLQALVTGATVIAVLMLFFRWVIKPYVENKLLQIQVLVDSVEPKVVAGVQLGVEQGLAQTLRKLPESTAKESSRQFMRFGSELFEHGLSSLLGSAEDLKRRSERR